MKKLNWILVSSMICSRVMAQQEAMVSQYMFNRFFINPAYAGTHENPELVLMHRTQWMGFEGAPKTSLITYDAAIEKYNAGLGFILLNDKIGSGNQTAFSLNPSYKIKAGKGQISFGIKAGVRINSLDHKNFKIWDENDPSFANSNTTFLADAGSGIYYYTEKSYFGISIPVLLAYHEDKKFELNSEKSAELRKHYYLQTGRIFNLKKNLIFRPTFLLKYVNSAPVQADITLSFLFDEKFWIGASYRTKESVSAIIEYQPTKKMRIGYSYDLNTTKIRKYSNGSHEILLAFTFTKKEAKVNNRMF